MSRLLIVSNRLPVKVNRTEQGPQLELSSGGLATGLSSLHEGGEGRWIGWSGDSDLPPGPEREHLEAEFAARRLVTVNLTAEEVERFYERYSNGILWPVFHYQAPPLEIDPRDFEAYDAVNRRFTDAVAAVYLEGDHIWVQDYQLLLLPEMLRRRLPGVRIGFFLHIPFPSAEVFMTLPQRDRLLAGMLGADLVGFHTASYMRAFAAAVLRVLGFTSNVDRIRIGSREVRLGVFPMGVDARAFAAVAAEPSVEQEVRALRGGDETRLLVGVDRLDYTKGIPRRLLAFERLLESHPELHGKIRLVQVAVPSREDVRAYQSFRSQAYELVGRIHGRFATAHWVPIYWIYRHLTREAVVALYRAADVMLVTPIRDGMNLVAKEFVASRTDGDGVLVLSEFAGAASELAEALLVNPFDEVGMAEAFHQAIRMPEDERRFRMRALRRRVFGYDVERWARSFVTTLQQIEKMEMPRGRTISTPDEIEALAARMKRADHLLLLLDFDGTIVPFTDSPELAKPDSELIDLLAALAARPGSEVHVVSSRSRDTLARWLGWLPIGLHVEHGLWSRGAGDSEWTCVEEPGREWQPGVISILEDWSARTPGSFVEEKNTCVAWHYRAADAEFAEHQAKELHVHLRDMLSNVPVEILSGDKVIEIRPHGAHKGRIVAPLLASSPPGTLAVAMGDDRSDEDLFEALPEGSVAIHVGPQESRAAYRLATVDDARALLASLLRTDGDVTHGAVDEK